MWRISARFHFFCKFCRIGNYQRCKTSFYPCFFGGDDILSTSIMAHFTFLNRCNHAHGKEFGVDEGHGAEVTSELGFIVWVQPHEVVALQLVATNLLPQSVVGVGHGGIFGSGALEKVQVAVIPVRQVGLSGRDVLLPCRQLLWRVGPMGNPELLRYLILASR